MGVSNSGVSIAEQAVPVQETGPPTPADLHDFNAISRDIIKASYFLKDPGFISEHFLPLIRLNPYLTTYPSTYTDHSNPPTWLYVGR